MISPAFRAPASVLLLSAALLSGCALGTQDHGGVVSMALRGRTMGGQQPVRHASIKLWAVSTSGYGMPSTSMLINTVSSENDGSFSISTDYHCPVDPTLVYITATSGDPGLDESGGTINNNALALMAVLGLCTDLHDSTFININELTTVAAVWSLAPFMKGYDQVGTTVTNVTGLANAFGMASNLVSVATGASPGNAPDGAIVPTEELNTLANILASCVNTKGYISGNGMACDNLFTQATPPGGAKPTNTIAAALDIAQNPLNNTAAIAAFSSPQAPFQPTLPAPENPSDPTLPNDWTVAITFPTGTSITNNMAFDAAGNLWIAASDSLYELSPTGVQLTPTDDQLENFEAMAGNTVAIDPDGNIWSTLSGSANIAKMSSAVGTPTPYPLAIGVPASGMAIDGSGNVWYSCNNCSNVAFLKPDGTPSELSTPVATPGSSSIITDLSVAPNEHVWVGNFNGSSVYAFSSLGSTVVTDTDAPYPCGNCGRPGYVTNDGDGNAWMVGSDLTRFNPTAPADQQVLNIEQPTGGLFNPYAAAIDGGGNVWVTNTNSLSNATFGSISEFAKDGTPITSGDGYETSSLSTPQNIAIDLSGNVWVRNSGAGTVTAFVGAGTPVITPFSLALKNGKLGSKP